MASERLSPSCRATLEGAGDVRRDPAAVELTRLWSHLFPVQGHLVEAAG